MPVASGDSSSPNNGVKWQWVPEKATSILHVVNDTHHAHSSSNRDGVFVSSRNHVATPRKFVVLKGSSGPSNSLNVRDSGYEDM